MEPKNQKPSKSKQKWVEIMYLKMVATIKAKVGMSLSMAEANKAELIPSSTLSCQGQN